MGVFDLLFIATSLFTLGSLAAALVATAWRRWTTVERIARRLGVVIAVYVAALLLTSLASPQHTLAVGDDLCSDEWCIAVTSAHRDPSAPDSTLIVDFRLSSKSRGRPQREQFVSAFALDSTGRRYAAHPRPDDVPFDTLIQPGSSVTARRRYTIPATARVIGVIIARTGAGRFPRCCIIGDDDSFLHAPALVVLR